jgi:integrase
MGFADFHSLRITFVTTLARANVPLALAQRLARHSTPVLTSNVYSRLELHDAAEAVSRLSFSAPTVREQARA